MKLKDEWAELTGQVVRPQRRRHTPEEMRLLFAHMHDKGVDPRLALAFDLGGEQRLGQVLRATRIGLELPVVAEGRIADMKPGTLGLLHVPGNQKKPTRAIVLTSDQRRAVESALNGYLVDYEALYRQGRISDYPLFPRGRFKEGKAKMRKHPLPLTRTGALNMFITLEEVAGVIHVPGRAWYGVRRVASDLAEDVEADERVLNAITAHSESSTRRGIYQQGERLEILNKAAATRAVIRKGDDGKRDEKRTA